MRKGAERGLLTELSKFDLSNFDWSDEENHRQVVDVAGGGEGGAGALLVGGAAPLRRGAPYQDVAVRGLGQHQLPHPPHAIHVPRVHLPRTPGARMQAQQTAACRGPPHRAGEGHMLGR